MKSSKTPRPSKPYNTGAATSSGTLLPIRATKVTAFTGTELVGLY